MTDAELELTLHDGLRLALIAQMANLYSVFVSPMRAHDHEDAFARGVVKQVEAYRRMCEIVTEQLECERR